MAAPVMTQNAAGNLANGVAIAASATSAAITVDATTKFELQIQFNILTGATAQAVATATVKIFRLFGSGPTSDNIPVTQFSIPMGAAATNYIGSIALPTGKYSFTVQNGDTGNAVSYSATSSTIDSIA